MEPLLLFYIIGIIIVLPILIYTELQRRKKFEISISGSNLFYIFLIFLISSTALVLNAIDYEIRLVCFLNTLVNLLMLVFVISLNKK